MRSTSSCRPSCSSSCYRPRFSEPTRGASCCGGSTPSGSGRARRRSVSPLAHPRRPGARRRGRRARLAQAAGGLHRGDARAPEARRLPRPRLDGEPGQQLRLPRGGAARLAAARSGDLAQADGARVPRSRDRPRPADGGRRSTPSSSPCRRGTGSRAETAAPPRPRRGCAPRCWRGSTPSGRRRRRPPLSREFPARPRRPAPRRGHAGPPLLRPREPRGEDRARAGHAPPATTGGRSARTSPRGSSRSPR